MTLLFLTSNPILILKILFIILILIIFIFIILPLINRSRIRRFKIFFFSKIFLIFNNIRYLLFFFCLLFLFFYFMSRIEFILISAFGIKNFFFFRVLRLLEFYILYKLDEKYDFLFKKEIIIFNFFEIFFIFIFVLFYFYFVFIHFQYYILTLPVLYFTFFFCNEKKNEFYQKILIYLNKDNSNFNFFFLKEQLEAIYYMLLFSCFYLYVFDLCHLENIEIIMVLGLNF